MSKIETYYAVCKILKDGHISRVNSCRFDSAYHAKLQLEEMSRRSSLYDIYTERVVVGKITEEREYYPDDTSWGHIVGFEEVCE